MLGHYLYVWAQKLEDCLDEGTLSRASITITFWQMSENEFRSFEHPLLTEILLMYEYLSGYKLSNV